MALLRNLLGKASGNVLKKEAKEPPRHHPYRETPLSSAQPTTPRSQNPPTSTLEIPSLGSDIKFDLSATYIPRSSAERYNGGAPPGYVSREPSVSTGSFQVGQGFRSVSDPVTRTAGLAAPTHLVDANQRRRSAAHSPMPTTRPPAVPVHLPEQRRNDTAPGDLPLHREAGQKITAEELSELGDLIRKRYQLDIQIHSERFLRPRDRDITQAKIREADALLSKIGRTVLSWDRPDFFEQGTGDYEAFQEVAERVLRPGKRDWVTEPPWSAVAVNRPERRQVRASMTISQR